MSYMSHEYLLETEANTAAEFAERLPAFQRSLHEYINTLFGMGYFVNGQSTDENWFPYIAAERFRLAPYTFRSVSLLASLGHNPEAYILLRHLLESFVQLRYFSANPTALRVHLEARNARGRTGFRDMFEALSPGYYRAYYSIASGVAHGGMHLTAISGVTRGETKGTLVPPLGCEFNEKKASMVVNQWLLLMTGFLVQAPNWFPTYGPAVATRDPSMESRRLRAISALNEWRIGHRAKFADSHDWIDKSTQLIGAS